jgi:hypothetical protein
MRPGQTGTCHLVPALPTQKKFMGLANPFKLPMSPKKENPQGPPWKNSDFPGICGWKPCDLFKLVAWKTLMPHNSTKCCMELKPLHQSISGTRIAEREPRSLNNSNKTQQICNQRNRLPTRKSKVMSKEKPSRRPSPLWLTAPQSQIKKQPELWRLNNKEPNNKTRAEVVNFYYRTENKSQIYQKTKLCELTENQKI